MIARWLADRAAGVATRARALQQRLCGLAGHTGGLEVAAGELRLACDSCDYRSPGMTVNGVVVERVTAPPPVSAAAAPPAVPPVTIGLVIDGGGRVELLLHNVYGPDGRPTVGKVPLSLEQQLELSVALFIAAVDTHPHEGHIGIGARCLAKRTNIPIAVAREIANGVVAQLVLHHTPKMGRTA